MQEKSVRSVNVIKRLDNLRRALGLNWTELASHLDVSRIMLHYVRTGKKPVSVKLGHRIEQAEVRAGIRQPLTSSLRQSEGVPLEPYGEWLNQLRRNWKQKKGDRAELELAIRIVFGNHSDQVLTWLEE